jgi:acid phosphatase
MLALGKRLRHLYVDQLNLLPGVLTNPEIVYFRSFPFPRALESLQHVISGFFPPGTLTSSFGDPQSVIRDLREETLLSNEEHCERFMQICNAFSRRTAIDVNFISYRELIVNLIQITRE